MNEKTKYQILRQREVMKGYIPSDALAEPTDQEQNLPFPLPLKQAKQGKKISLPLDFDEVIQNQNLLKLLKERESVRVYSEDKVSLKELSFFLWVTQGVRSFAGKENQVTFRNVPSAGSRHPLETYLFVSAVEELPKGIYHYLPSGHELEVWELRSDYREELTEALCGQKFAGYAPVTFVWSAIPYRTEWRYGLKGQKYILLDAGHVCENLYLACEAAGCGVCAIGAYDQEALDELLGFSSGPSGEEDNEFAVYVAAVGKKKH